MLVLVPGADDEAGFGDAERGREMGRERIEDANSSPEVDVPCRRISVESWVRGGGMMYGCGWGEVILVSML